MKITIEHYNYTHTVEMEDDTPCDIFCERVEHLISAIWGSDVVEVAYSENYAKLREAVDKFVEENK